MKGGAMAIKTSASQPTISYHALRGSYGKVTYFIAKTSLRDVAENLELAPQETLNFSERIQRVVNTKRVEQELFPYLKSNELRFFNSLVCILLPDPGHTSGFWEFEEYADADGNRLGGLGLLRISKDVARVVLDGQHRYEALRMYWNSIKDMPQADAHAIEVALVFVVVDHLGQMGTKGTQLRNRTIEATRNLFAVLNKTARPVDKNTLLLIDDSDLCNVITRRMLEERIIDDLYVKWATSLNLNPYDPYFTVLQVIRDAVAYYLRDFPEEVIDYDYGAEDERKAALKKYYLDTPKTEVPLRAAIPEIILSGHPFKKWKALLKTHKIDLAPQPKQTVLLPKQTKPLQTMRNEQLVYTVAGQKTFFRAVIDAFYGGQRRDIKRMRAVITRANRIFDEGFFSRSTDEKNPYLGVLFDSKGRMSWAESAVDRARMILSVALESGIDQQSVLSGYESFTGRAPEVVSAYWQAVRAKI
jgi:DGQHR domain-containing protein